MPIDDMCFSLGSRLFWQGSHVATLPPIIPEDKVWTQSCWHIFPQMPSWNKESAHAVRRWQVRPKGANGASLLKLGRDGFVDISKVSKGRGFQSLIH